MWISGETRVIPAEGTARAKALRWEQAWCVRPPRKLLWSDGIEQGRGQGGKTGTRGLQTSHSPCKISLQSRNCSHPDFTDEETGTGSLSNSSGATQGAEHGCEPGSSSILGLYRGV